MEQRRTDAQGGLVRRGGRRSKLAVVVVVQNLLMVAGLLAVFLVRPQPRVPEDIVHIEFASVATVLGNETIVFPLITSSHIMHLTEDKTTIIINCTAPYVWYMDVCYDSTLTNVASGMLQLWVEGNKSPVTSIELKTTPGVCRGLSSTVYLRATELASVYLRSDEAKFMISNVTMGLSSLLGKRCEF